MGKKISNLNVRNLKAGSSSVGSMNVQRLNVNTGDEKGLSHDQMKEILNILKGQTEQSKLKDIDESIKSLSEKMINSARSASPAIPDGTLNSNETGSNSVKKLLKDIRQAIITNTTQSATGGGGGGEGDSFGRSVGPGESATAARLFTSASLFSDQMVQSSKLLQRWDRSIRDIERTMKRSEEINVGLITQSLLMKGAFETVRGQMINLGDVIQDTGAKLTKLNLSDFRRIGVERFTEALGLATSGVEEFGKTFWDLGALTNLGGLLGETRDSIKITSELIAKLQDSSVLNPYGVIGGTTSEVATSVRRLRRGFIDAGNPAASLLNPTDANEAILHLLALEKRRDITAHDRDRKTLRNIDMQLYLAQKIASNTGKTASEIIKLNFERNKEVSNLISSGILSERQGFNWQRAMDILSKDPNATPIVELLRNIAGSGGQLNYFLGQNQNWAGDLAATGNLGTMRELVNMISSGAFSENDIIAASSQFTRGSLTGAAAAQNISPEMRQVLGASSSLRGTSFGEGAGTSRTATWIRSIQDIIMHSFGGLVGAIGLNITALLANTWALYRTRPGLKGVASGIGGMYGGIKKLLGKSLLKKIPLIGLGAGALFALPHLLKGNFGMAGAEVASGAASLVPGVGTAASFAIDAGIAANSIGPSSPSMIAKETKTERRSSTMQNTLDKIAEGIDVLSPILKSIEKNTGMHGINGIPGINSVSEVPATG